MNTADKIKVMAASEDGKTIQYRDRGDTGRWGIANCPTWNWGLMDYRVKPIISNIIIQNLTREQQELVEFSMRDTGEETATKAIFESLRQYRSWVE